MSADAGEIAGVDVRAWWHAYQGFLDGQRLLERTVEQQTSAWRANLAAEGRRSARGEDATRGEGADDDERWARGERPAEGEDHGCTRETWVMEVAGRIAGYASVGPSCDADAAPETGSIAALYVDPPAQGAGVGTALLAHAHERLSALGHRRATLWTFEANGLARTFYERHGWELDPSGAGNEDCEWWAPAVRYARDLGLR